MRFLACCLFLVVIFAVAGSAAASPPNEVQVTATGFTPQELTIKPGETVVWKWDSAAGPVTVKDGTVQDENPGQVFQFSLNAEKTEYSRTFDETGTFRYFASEFMTGVISVKEATPVTETTWGWLKSVFEAPGAPGSRR